MERQASELKNSQRLYLEVLALSLRPRTVINSRTGINAFIRYLESEHPQLSSFSKLDRSHIEGWIRHLANRPLRRSTRRNYLVKVRLFLKATQELGWNEAPQDVLFRQGDLPPQDRYLPRPLSEETDRALQEELRRRGLFIHKAILFLRLTGLRSQELLDLKVHSLRKLPGNEAALHVPLGKLHSERVIPLDAEAAKIFEEICKLRGSPPPVTDPETGKPEHFLLVRPDGRRFTREALRYHLGKIQTEVPLTEHPTPHRLRHNYATEMLRAGMRLPILMKLLGHRTIAMTLRYAEVTGLDVRRAYFDTTAVLEDRYKLPPSPRGRERSADTLTPHESIAFHLRAAATEMERLRRDRATGSQNKKLQRFVERMRRLEADLKGLTS